jgi:ribosomal protein S27E
MQCPKCKNKLYARVIVGENNFNPAYYSIACSQCNWKTIIWDSEGFEVLE